MDSAATLSKHYYGTTQVVACVVCAPSSTSRAGTPSALTTFCSLAFSLTTFPLSQGPHTHTHTIMSSASGARGYLASKQLPAPAKLGFADTTVPTTTTYLSCFATAHYPPPYVEFSCYLLLAPRPPQWREREALEPFFSIDLCAGKIRRAPSSYECQANV